MSENPIIVDEPRTGLFDGTVHMNSSSALNGGGLFYDAYTLTNDLSDGNWVGVGIDVASSALDTLAFVEDPLRGLLSAGIGWLIEHVSFLSEPLDYLAGDPDLVQEKAQTWKNIKQALETASADYSTSAEALLQQYTGTAAQAYSRSANNFAGLVGSTSAHAENAATAMTVAAAIVGTTRGIVRDWISNFVAQAIEKWIVAAATSVLDFGASAAIFIADEVVEGSILAEKTSSKLAEIASKLEQLAAKAEHDAGTLGRAATSVQKDASKLSRQVSAELKDTSGSVKAASATAKNAFKDAEKSGFTGTANAAALSSSRSASHDLDAALNDARVTRTAAEDAARATGSKALGDTSRQAGKVERDVQKRIDELTQQRRDITAHRLGLTDKQTEALHEPLKTRVEESAKEASKPVEVGAHGAVEAGRQGTTETHNRGAESAEQQDEREELPDGSLVERE